MRRTWTWLLVFTLATVFVAPPTFFWMRRGSEAADAQLALSSAIAETGQTDPVWNWAALHPRTTDPVNSVGELLNEFGNEGWSQHQQPEERLDFLFDRMQAMQENHQATPQMLEYIDESLSRLSRPLEQMLQLPQRVPSQPACQVQPGDSILFPPACIGLRYVSRMLRAHILRQAMRGETDAAINDLQSLHRAMDSLNQDAILVSQLLHQSVLQESVRMMERILGQLKTPADLRDIQAWYEARLLDKPVVTAMRGERAWWHAMFDAVEQDRLSIDHMLCMQTPNQTQMPTVLESFRLRPRLPHNHADMLRWHNSIIEIAQLPIHDQRRAFRMYDSPASPYAHAGIAAIYKHSYETILNATQSTHTITACMVVALACERYRQDYHKWPENLAELMPHYLKAIPIDPIGGQPIRYVRVVEGAIIYGVGFDLMDNEGNLTDYRFTESTDLGIRIWNLEERAMPAPPSTTQTPGFR